MYLLIFLGLKTLGEVPQSLFWAAIKGLREVAVSKRVHAFYRRVALISLCGGIPVHFLDTLDSFEYKPEQFQSIGLPLNQSQLDDGSLYDISQVEFNFKTMLEEIEKKLTFSEADLRTFFWDPLLVDCFRGTGKPWAIRSEVILDKLLDLDCSRRANLAVLISVLEQVKVIFFCEMGEEEFFANTEHKDFAKLNALLTI